MNENHRSATVEKASTIENLIPDLPPGVGTRASSAPVSGVSLANGKRASNVVRKHVISLYVNNKPGVLIRIALVFARRGYNIDSLVVSEGHDPAFSHMNITATGDEKTLQQILMQLNKLVDVVRAKDHTGADIIQRELALIKLKCTAEKRNEILQVAHVFKCVAVNLTDTTITLEVTGETEKIDALHRMLNQYGILEMVRTGHVLIARGEDTTY
jgi:acetolactate synthase-1/3 small subunit